MAQMKPIDLKEVAKRFTEKYYPQYSHRVDRIWAMFESLDFDSYVSENGEPQFQLGNAFGISGTVEPESQEAISGIAFLAFTYQSTVNENAISEDDFKKRISIAPVLMNLTPDLQKKLEDVFLEIVPSMVDNAESQNENLTIPNSIKDQSGIYKTKGVGSHVVYISHVSGYGAEKTNVSEEEVHSRFLLNKEQYDIIIYYPTVEIKSITQTDNIDRVKFDYINLHSNILNLLILFLKYKDKELPYLSLYHCAWKDSVHHQRNAKEASDIINDLKSGISKLRKKIKLEKFDIPDAKRNNDSYICRGNFSFCLVLSEIMDQEYYIEDI